MEITILGSGGCTVIPRPLCQCRICREARWKGAPYERTGPSLYIHDENILVDTPAEIGIQLNRSRINTVDHIMLTHFDPDHFEGFRVVEQISLDFRSWEAYPDKQINVVLPRGLIEGLKKIRSVYGPLFDYYEQQKFITIETFSKKTTVGSIEISAIPVERGDQISIIYVFEKQNKKMVLAPCDIKPFPESDMAVQNAELLLIQPGIFETGLKHEFTYPENHISRKTLYTFEETIELAERINADKVLMVHIEEYWNRSYDDYYDLQYKYKNVMFACDGMHLTV